MTKRKNKVVMSVRMSQRTYDSLQEMADEYDVSGTLLARLFINHGLQMFADRPTKWAVPVNLLEQLEEVEDDGPGTALIKT